MDKKICAARNSQMSSTASESNKLLGRLKRKLEVT